MVFHLLSAFKSLSDFKIMQLKRMVKNAIETKLLNRNLFPWHLKCCKLVSESVDFVVKCCIWSFFNIANLLTYRLSILETANLCLDTHDQICVGIKCNETNLDCQMIQIQPPKTIRCIANPENTLENVHLRLGLAQRQLGEIVWFIFLENIGIQEYPP